MSDSTKASVLEARNRLKTHFDQPDFEGEKQGEGWSKLWDQGDFLPWDRGFPNPALLDLLKERQGLIGNASTEVDGKTLRKKALVPGCGRGVDVLLLQSFGYDAVGLEYSQAAVDACIRHAKEHGHDYPVNSEKVGKGSAKFVVGDFFKSEWMSKADMGEGEKFDLIYDYTVGCLHKGGPPFGSPPDAYMKHLSHPGHKLPHDTDGSGDIGSPVEASKDGLERVAHWQPARTHEIGKDENGNVRDFIAIWRHH